MRVYAVVNRDDGRVCIVQDEESRDVALVTTDESFLPTMREIAEHSRELGYNVELKEFDIRAPYPMSKALSHAENAKLLGEKPHPLCQCDNGMAPMFCPFGHLTECHYPMNCREANCSHLERYE